MLYCLGDDINVNSDWDTSEFRDNFEGTWVSLPDSQGLTYFISEEDAYILYTSPILLNGEEMFLRFARLWADADDDFEMYYGEAYTVDSDFMLEEMPLREGVYDYGNIAQAQAG